MDDRSRLIGTDEEIVLEVEDAVWLVIKFDCGVKRTAHVVVLVEVDCKDGTSHVIIDHLRYCNKLVSYVSNAPSSCWTLK